MFFHYHQNNSGGVFHINDKVHENIIIEANDKDHADTLAESIGIYFDGIDKGQDCECCGDRWSRQYSNDGDKFPTLYGRDITCVNTDLIPFVNDKVTVIGYVYYLNGKKGLIQE